MKRSIRGGIRGTLNILLVLLIVAGYGQQQKVLMSPGIADRVSTPVGSKEIISAYWRYLPPSYAGNPTQKYPLLIFIHGLDERRMGTSEELNKILNVRNSPPQQIYNLDPTPPVTGLNNGGLAWPVTFTVDGAPVEFVVISLQYNNRPAAWVPTPAEFDDFLEHVKATYRIDEKRVYLTGTSSGGPTAIHYIGENVNYARKIAGVALMSAASSTAPQQYRIDNIASQNVPFWAFSYPNDPYNPNGAPYSTGYVNGINAYSPKPNPEARMIVLPGSGHNSWSSAYDKDTKIDGKNIFEWLLSFQRNDAGDIVPLPVTWNHFEARLYEGSVLLSWSTVMEKENAFFTVERQDEAKQFVRVGDVPGSGTSALVHQYQFTDNNPPPGVLQYRIRQTDLNGTVSYSKTIRVAERPAGNQPLLLFPNPQAAGRAVMLEMTDWRNKQVTVGVYDSQGRLVLTQKAALNGGGRLSLTPALAPGLYQVSIQQGGVRRLSTLVLQ